MKSKIFLDKKAIQTFDYPTTPKRNLQLRKDNQALVITNLFPLEYLSQFHKLYNYSIEILPTISDDNFPLKRVIYNKLETELPSGFRKIIFHGNNLYACVTVEKDLNLTNIEKTVKVQNQDYSVKLKFAAEINFRNLCFNDNENQEIKHIIEKLIRFIIMRNPNVIKFKDGTMVDISTKNMNIKSVSESQGENSLEQIYRGYMTSVQITESGYFMRINDVNKIISGKSALKKILEIREENRNLNKDDLFKKINQYFSEHRTVLAKYGNLRTYRVANINFDKSPKNTNITLREKDGKETQCNLVNYYKNQYDLKIKDENQPLIEVELLKKKGPNTEQEKETIYLIPELVFLTGLEHGTNSDDNTTKRKITSKTKMRPGDKVNAIRSIFNLLNSSTNKIYTNKQGKEVKIKSPKEMQELYGIKIGNNLVVNARVMPQPHLMFNHAEKFVIPNNGIFRADNPNKVMKFSNENLFYVCDSRERDDARKVFNGLMMKCKQKKFIFSNDFRPDRVKEYCLQRSNNWNDISSELNRLLPNNNNHQYGFVFLSPSMEKNYPALKNYFYKKLGLITQFGITKKLADKKRGNSIQFNLVDQFNVKIGGENHHINFVKENIMKNSDVFLVIGLKTQVERATGKVKYCMTSSRNKFLNYINTSIKECENNKQQRDALLTTMFKDAIQNLMKQSPNPPNYIILYRKGGNYIENIQLALDEKDIFIKVITDLEEMLKKTKNISMQIPFYYICCNLKSDMKFFEVASNDSKSYANPKSGLIIDEGVTQKNRFEFYIQPQFVNQGTATPSHYQVMCSHQHNDDVLKLEQLEKLTFYLCYYYFTWAGAIREPGALKMAETALDFSVRCFIDQKGNDDVNYFYQDPIYL
jgi:aubergine-like protein